MYIHSKTSEQPFIDSDDFKTTTFSIDDHTTTIDANDTHDPFLPVMNNYTKQQQQQQQRIGSKNNLIFKSMREEYSNYTQCILWLKLHGMITAFFMLWNLATKTTPQELVATKFLHVLAPFLALHWWHLSNYPIHLYMLLTSDENNKDSNPEEHEPNIDIFSRRMELRIYEVTFFNMLLYFTLVSIDVLYFCIKLVPLANTCFAGNNDGSGNSLPPECDSNYDENDPSSHNTTLFVISFVLALVHIILGMIVIGVIFKTRNRVHKSKIL